MVEFHSPANCRVHRIPGPASGSIVYLGALLTSSGLIDAELSRRIGMAAGYFQKLQKLWGNSGISRQQKPTAAAAAAASSSCR